MAYKPQLPDLPLCLIYLWSSYMYEIKFVFLLDQPKNLEEKVFFPSTCYFSKTGFTLELTGCCFFPWLNFYQNWIAVYFISKSLDLNSITNENPNTLPNRVNSQVTISLNMTSWIKLVCSWLQEYKHAVGLLRGFPDRGEKLN